MVCLGNICRSPLAEGILKSKSKNIYVDSAGTAGYHIGKKPDSRSIEIGLKHNIDITDQRARQFNSDDFSEFDKIYVMDNDNYSKIISLAKNQEEIDKVDLILNEIYPNEYMSRYKWKNIKALKSLINYKKALYPGYQVEEDFKIQVFQK